MRVSNRRKVSKILNMDWISELEAQSARREAMIRFFARPRGWAKNRIIASRRAGCASSSEIQSMLRILETFRRFETLIQWNGTHFVEAFEATLKSQEKLLWSDRAARFAIHEAQRVSDGVPHLILNLTGDVEMTKTTKAMLAGAAFAGLFAGAGAAVKASTLLPSLKSALNAHDHDQKSDKQD